MFPTTRRELAAACLVRCIYMVGWNVPEFAASLELLEEYIEYGALGPELQLTVLRAAVRNKETAEDMFLHRRKPMDECEMKDWDKLCTVLRKGIHR